MTDNRNRPVLVLHAFLTSLCLASLPVFAGVEVQCPSDMGINACDPSPIDSMFVLNDDLTPGVISYLVTDSQGWSCLPIVAGIHTFYAGQVLQLGANCCVADTLAPGTTSSFTLRARHQSETDGPALTISADDLGTWSFQGLDSTGHPVINVEQNQSLSFSWGGEGDYYRFGWDVADPFDVNDPGWAVPFQTLYHSWSIRYSSGTHTLTVQSMDNNAFVSMGCVVINVIPVPGASVGSEVAFVRDVLHPDVTGAPSYSECTFLIYIVESPVGWASLTYPSWIMATSGEATPDIYGQVWIDCVTSNPGATSGLVAEVGYGPDGSDPSVSADDWQWAPASFVADVGGNDEYVAALTNITVGTYDFCYRYAYNAGPWVYGDLDGSANGYLPGQAGSLEVIDPTGVLAAPTILRLYPNQPNPFNPLTTLRFDVPIGGRVHLEVYDVAGRLVRTLLDVDLPAGSHQAVWDGKDERGMGVASGSYFARLSAGGKVETVSIGLVR